MRIALATLLALGLHLVSASASAKSIDVTAPPYNANGGDALADDAALQAAINDHPWETIYIPRGKYYVTQPLVLNPAVGIRIVGDGFDPNGNEGTVIRNTGTGDVIRIASATSAGDHVIYLADLTLFGTATSANGISISNVNGVVLERLWVAWNGGDGISLYRAWGTRISNCVVTHNRRHGISLNREGNNILISGNKINANALGGGGYANVWLSAPAGYENLGVTITANDISYAGDAPAVSGVNAVGLAIQNTHGVVVSGNYMEYAGSNLVYVGANVTGIVVSGNYFQDGQVLLDTATMGAITANRFRYQDPRYTTQLRIQASGKVSLSMSGNSYSPGATESVASLAKEATDHYATTPPTSGTWSRGDIVWNSAPAARSPAGWICVAAGSPGIWKTLAIIGN